MNDKHRSVVLVTVQFGVLIALLVTTKQWHFNAASMALLFLSAALMFWAMLVMSKSRLRVQPIPAPDATMIIAGPYRFIRHPMYSSLLLGSAGLLIMYFSLFRLLLVLILIIDLLFKLHFEERLLTRKFSNYTEYKAISKRLVPFIY
ncbi:MAG: hypothetical protein JSU05_00625 [Bacteroidetes bacterium]|nr:hypothetical protein [Bacteroidota bacterium]